MDDERKNSPPHGYVYVGDPEEHRIDEYDSLTVDFQ